MDAEKEIGELLGGLLDALRTTPYEGITHIARDVAILEHTADTINMLRGIFPKDEVVGDTESTGQKLMNVVGATNEESMRCVIETVNAVIYLHEKLGQEIHGSIVQSITGFLTDHMDVMVEKVTTDQLVDGVNMDDLIANLLKDKSNE